MGKGMLAGKNRKSKSREKEISYRQSIPTPTTTEVDNDRFMYNVRARVQNELTLSLAYQHNIDMLSFLLALRDEFSFGKQRLLRVLEKASKHAEYAFTHNMTTEDLIEVLHEETGLTSKDLTFEVDLIQELDL